MAAGRLRHRVTLKERDPAAAKNAYNESADEWLPLLEDIPAEVYAYAGREYVAAQQTQAAVSHRVTIRTPARIAVQPVHRFEWIETLQSGTRITHLLDIKQVAPLQRRPGYTECLCTEHVGG